MKPCCLPTEQRCVDVANDWDEGWCDANGGTLGPEGACCENPDEGDCTASDPDRRCWRCPWEVQNPDEIRPCCFVDWGYQFYPHFSLEQCQHCGGETLNRERCEAPVSALRRPCCTGWGACYNLSSGQAWRCEAEWGGALGPVGVCCQDPEPVYDFDCASDVAPGHVCWRCGWDPGELAGSCCFADLDYPGYQWFGNVKIKNCLNCGGEVGYAYEGEEECSPPVPEPECIDAPREDRPNPAIVDFDGTRLQWTLDTIGTVVFGMSAVGDVRKGYQCPVSVHLIRPKQADTPAESCGHAGGRKTMLDDGYVYVETCSKPDRTSEDSFRRSYGLMRTFLPEENTPLAQHNRALGMRDGYQYSVTCIRHPWWAEATYRSHMARCGSDPI